MPATAWRHSDGSPMPSEPYAWHRKASVWQQVKSITQEYAQADLPGCDLEPIHHIGAIQPVGFLIATSSDWPISRLSTNATDFLGSFIQTLLGALTRRLRSLGRSVKGLTYWPIRNHRGHVTRFPPANGNDVNMQSGADNYAPVIEQPLAMRKLELLPSGPDFSSQPQADHDAC